MGALVSSPGLLASKVGAALARGLTYASRVRSRLSSRPIVFESRDHSLHRVGAEPRTPMRHSKLSRRLAGHLVLSRWTFVAAFDHGEIGHCTAPPVSTSAAGSEADERQRKGLRADS
jgi:uncharacterized membrane protein